LPASGDQGKRIEAVTCSRRSMIGSPKASTRQSSKMRRRCLTNRRVTCLVIRHCDGATIFSGVAFTRGPRPAESSSFALRRNGRFGQIYPSVVLAHGRRRYFLPCSSE
jgi:hypothetical protein